MLIDVPEFTQNRKNCAVKISLGAVVVRIADAILYALFLASIVSCKGKQFRYATCRKRKFVTGLQDSTVL